MNRRKFRLNLNIGTVIFGLIFLYLFITFITFITHRHIETYQVITGPLSKNETATAIILRNEEVVKTNATGYVNHFVSNGSKTGKDQMVCAVTTSVVPNEYKNLSANEYQDLRYLAAKSSKSFDPKHFDTINDLKFDILGSLWNTNTVSESAGNFYKNDKAGYISYSCDGYENLKEEDLRADMFKSAVYSIPKLTNQTIVEPGDSLYRVTYSEDWALYFPISDKQTIRLSQLENLKVKFLKDGTSEKGILTFLVIGDQRFAKITFSQGMYRYIGDRYVDIELVTNNQTGLKIPVSSIVKKEFYTIPENYVTYQGKDQAGFIKEVINSDGSKSREFVEVTLFAKVHNDAKDIDEYYVDKTSFNYGDILVDKDTNEKYTIGYTGNLDGVYCVNKGYSVFRKISIIDQNDEYCIVESNTSFGIAQYDYIVKNGSTVKESDIIY